MYEFVKQEVKISQKKAPEDRSSNKPIIARFQKTINRIVQSDYSGRTYKSDGNLVRMRIRPKDLIGPSDLYVLPE